MRRSLGVAAVFSALLAVVIGEGGCEIAIGDTVPGVNVCNGGPDPCPPNQVCDIKAHECVTNCTIAHCSGDMVCSASGLCIPADAGSMDDVMVNDSPDAPDTADVVDSMTEEEATPPPDTGPPDTNPCPGGILCGCSGDSSCNSKLCVGQVAVGTGLYQAANSMSFCSQPCCISADCPATTVCYATGQGGNYCVDPTWIGRMAVTNAGSLGGASCPNGGRDCRSGLCTGGHCVDTCCSTEQAANECAGGTTCNFDNFPGATAIDKNYGAFCGTVGGSGADGSSCSNNSDCQSYLCAAAPGESFNKCKDACRSSSDCTGSYHCNYVIPPNPPTPTPVVAACFTSQGNLTMGQTCDPANDQCKGFCDPSSNKCTDVCFGDSDCSAMSGWRCRDSTISVQGGGSYTILCCGT